MAAARKVWEGNDALKRLLVPIESLLPHPLNPRRHDLAAIRASLRAFGQQRPVLVVPAGRIAADHATIIAGHGTTAGAAEALARAESHFRNDDGCGQAAAEYQQFAWRAKQPVVRNSYCDIVVALRTNVQARYRGEAGLKEDRDYTLQLRAEGWSTTRITEVGFAAPTMGTNRGGLFEEYRAGRERESAEALARLWPDLVSVVRKPNGRIDARINWRGAGAA
jgi:hypothetical protein